MRTCNLPIASLLPHQPPMIMLDEIIGYDDKTLIAGVTITERSLFFQDGGVPGYVGLEYMAQACGAYAGVQALGSGGEVRIGYLLGSRDYRVTVPCFRLGDRLLVTAAIAFHDDAIAAFACHITIDAKLVAEAHLSVYQAGENH